MTGEVIPSTKSRKSNPQRRGTQSRRGAGCEHPAITAVSVSPAQTQQSPRAGRIQMACPSPRSGGEKITTVLGVSATACAASSRGKHLACRDIFLLYSWQHGLTSEMNTVGLSCIFCSSRHSWGKSYISSEYLIAL